mgnify:CR=1 FL=1
MPQITHVVKRNGTLVPFTPERITNAIYRAAVAVGGRDRKTSQELASQVVALLERNTPEGEFPTIEQIQDLVEKVLIENGHARVAKASQVRPSAAGARGIGAAEDGMRKLRLRGRVRRCREFPL